MSVRVVLAASRDLRGVRSVLHLEQIVIANANHCRQQLQTEIIQRSG